MESPFTIIGGGAFAINKSEMINEELVAGAPGFEPETSCAQGKRRYTSLLVCLALFRVMKHVSGLHLAVVGPKLDSCFWGDVSYAIPVPKTQRCSNAPGAAR